MVVAVSSTMELGGLDGRKRFPSQHRIGLRHLRLMGLLGLVGPRPRWFQYAWEAMLSNLDISVKELFPIVVAAAVWDDLWRGANIICHCDNQVVVAVMGSRPCRDKQLMHLLQCLFYYEAHGQFRLYCRHVLGRSNGIADDLSRDNLLAFFSKLLGANRSLTPISRALPQLLLSNGLDWLSPTWTLQFRATLNRVQLHHYNELTSRLKSDLTSSAHI